MARAANRQSSIYLGKDGHWHGRVTVGRKDDGSIDRRHVMSKSKGTVVTKVRALERLRDEPRVPKAGRAWTVEKWLLHWLEEIARPTIRESSFQATGRQSPSTCWRPSARCASTVSNRRTSRRSTDE